jgi:hypothetical protein
MTYFDIVSVFCNVSIVIANTIIFLIYAFGAVRVPKFTGFWFLMAAYPFYILLASLNLLAALGKNSLLSVIPKDIFLVIYPVSLAIAPIGALFAMVGAFLVVRYVVNKESEKTMNK